MFWGRIMNLASFRSVYSFCPARNLMGIKCFISFPLGYLADLILIPIHYYKTLWNLWTSFYSFSFRICMLQRITKQGITYSMTGIWKWYETFGIIFTFLNGEDIEKLASKLAGMGRFFCCRILTEECYPMSHCLDIRNQLKKCVFRLVQYRSFSISILQPFFGITITSTS